MSVGSQVSDERSGKYELTEQLGAGAIAAVYLGESAGRKIAVKVPHSRLPTELEERFWQELGVLSRLHKAAGGKYFPDAWRGTLNGSGRPVLCMSLVQGERLVTLAFGNPPLQPKERELLGLRAGLEYAQMVGVLAREKVSCTDRKLDDLYWDKTLQRLMVLDWNVVEQGDKAQASADLYVFGRLWYELLTGGLPSPVDERIRRPLEGHPNWGQLSLGSQQVLRRSLHPQREKRYASAEELHGALLQQHKDWSRNADHVLRDAKELVHKVSASFDRGLATLNAARGVSMYDQQAADEKLAEARAIIQEAQRDLPNALRLADLAKRQGAAGADQVWEDARALQQKQDELIVAGSRFLTSIQYTAASQWLQVAEETASDDPLGLLRLKRWSLLAEAGQLAIKDGLSLRDRLPALTGVVEALDRSQFVEADSRWQRVREDLRAAGWQPGQATFALVETLGCEAAFWVASQAAGDHEQKKQFGKAAASLRLAAEKVQQVRYQEQLLAASGATLEELGERALHLDERHQIEGRVREQLEAGDKNLDAGDFSAAIDAFDTGLRWASIEVDARDLRKELEDRLRLASALSKLDNALAREAWDSVFAVVENELAAKVRHPRAIELAREAIIMACGVLSQQAGPGTQPWQAVRKGSEAARLEALGSHLKRLDATYHDWLYFTMDWTGHGYAAGRRNQATTYASSS